MRQGLTINSRRNCGTGYGGLSLICAELQGLNCGNSRVLLLFCLLVRVPLSADARVDCGA